MAEEPARKRKRVRFSVDDDVSAAMTPQLDGNTRETLLPGPDKGEASPTRPLPQDEGPIKSTNPEFAAAVRARNRKEIENLKAGEALDVSLVDEITLAEEADEDDVEVRFTEDGIQIEPFNLRAERSRGFFDAEGNYVAYRGEDDTDAWLETLPAGPVEPVLPPRESEASTSAHRKGRDAKPNMTEAEKQAYRQRVVQALLPGETVLAALRRLGGDANRPARDQASGDSRAARFAALRSRLAGTVPERNRGVFTQLTEDAGQLLIAGDAGIYTTCREQLVPDARQGMGRAGYREDRLASSEANALADWLASAVEEDEGRPDENQEAQEAAAAPADPETDMFADSASPGPSPPPASAEGVTRDDGGQGNAEQASEDTSGFVYDEGSRLYYNTALGCYFDAERQLYRDAASGRWYAYKEGTYQQVSS